MSRKGYRAAKRQQLLSKSTGTARKPYKPLRPKDVVFDRWTGHVRVKVS